MDVFEFNDLDALWAHVKDLKQNECRDVRHTSQGAQGVFTELKDDQRFNDFKWNNARYRQPDETDDPRRFTICRKP